MAHSLAATVGYLLEEFKHLLAGKREETDFVLERSHLAHITYVDIALGKVSTDAPHVIHREDWLLIKLAGTPYQDIAKQVTQLTLRAMAGHIMSHGSHYRSHDAIHLVLIRGDELRSLSIRLCIPFPVYQNTGSLHLCHLEFLGKGWTCHQHQSHGGKHHLHTILFLHTFYNILISGCKDTK